MSVSIGSSGMYNCPLLYQRQLVCGNEEQCVNISFVLCVKVLEILRTCYSKCTFSSINTRRICFKEVTQ